MTSDRDPAIGTLLERIEVEPPGPTFWDDLRTRLDTGAPVVDLRPAARPDGARPRRRVLVGLAAAAAVAVIALLVSRSGSDQPQRVVPIGQDTTTSTHVPAINLPANDPQQAALLTATRWAQAVRLHDADTAWSMLGPQSRDMLGTRAAFDQLMAGPLQQTWDPLVGAVRGTSVALSSAGDTSLWMFELSTADGAAHPAVAGFIVRVQGAAAQVEPFIPGPALDLISLPSTGSAALPSVARGATVTVHIAADVTAFVVTIDGSAVPTADLGGNIIASVYGVSTSSLTPGRHDIAVATVGPNGALAADVRPFTVRP